MFSARRGARKALALLVVLITNKEVYPTRVIPARRLSWRAGLLTPKMYLAPEAFSVPMGSRRCDGIMPARRMAEPIMFIMSQSRPCTSQIWICEITSYVTMYDCSLIKITRTDTTSLSYRKAGLGGEPYKGETPPDLPVLTS